MHKYLVRHFAAAELQDGRPKQRVESDDVFANEMVLLNTGVVDVSVKILTAFVQQVFQRRQVANGCVQPHIKIFAGGIGNFDAKVRRVAADVPVAQTLAGAAVGVAAHTKPLFHFIGDFRLQVLAVLRPVL